MGKRRLEPNKVYKAIGLKIRSIRESRGWTLEDCEEHGNISWQQLQKIESGRNVTVRTLINLANLFEIKLVDLVDI